MTKKHFIELAKILNKYNTCESTTKDLLRIQAFQELTMDITEYLMKCNPLFDKERFLKACGVEVEQEKNDGTNCVCYQYNDNECKCKKCNHSK